MAGPAFAVYMNPLISALKKLGGSARPDEVCARIANDLSLSDDVLDKTLKNGQSHYKDQVHWARFHLVKTGYLDNSSPRGVWALTEKGQRAHQLSEEEIEEITKSTRNASAKTKTRKSTDNHEQNFSQKSDETIFSDMSDTSYREELLRILKSLPSFGFERVCQRLLREAGFENVEVTGRSGDGGIDGNGILQINPLVSFQVVFQCKRYKGSVTSSQIRDFRGAMEGRAEKGIVLTTGSFTSDAKREAMRDGARPIELVDGEKLVEMFEKLELGVKPRTTYDIDPKFFKPFEQEDL